MFDRFTDSAKKALHLGRQEANRLQHEIYLTEHLLLGLVAEEVGAAARYLAARGIGLADLRAEVDAQVARGTAAAAPQLPFGLRTKKALELAMEEAQIVGHTGLGTVHLLLGLLREGESLGARLLAKYGIDLASVRAFAAANDGSEAVEVAFLSETAERIPSSFPWPITPEAERVLALGLREAAGLGQAIIGPEHLLLGLLADADSPAARFLKELDLTLESYREFLRGE